MEWHDFNTMWEARFIEVMKPYLDPAPAFVEGSRLAEYEDGSIIAVGVEMGDELQGTGFYKCIVTVEFEYSGIDNGEEVSKRWGQVMQAVGNGISNAEPLRTRLPSGFCQIPKGIGTIVYDLGSEDDAEQKIKTFQFSAWLGLNTSGITQTVETGSIANPYARLLNGGAAWVLNN